MTTPGATVAALLLALFCAALSLIGIANGWLWVAVGFGLPVVFLIVLALTYLIPAAVDAALEQENDR